MRDTSLPRIDQFMEIGEKNYRWNEGNRSWDETVGQEAYLTGAVHYFAELNDADEVIWLTHIDPSRSLTEREGEAYCKSLFGEGTKWAQGGFGKRNHPQIGHKFFRDLDLFLPHKPYPSWVVDYVNFTWKAPVPYPSDGKFYSWDEAKKGWVLIDPQPEWNPEPEPDPSGITGNDYAD